MGSAVNPSWIAVRTARAAVDELTPIAVARRFDHHAPSLICSDAMAAS
jgi:hypothetical protein